MKTPMLPRGRTCAAALSLTLLVGLPGAFAHAAPNDEAAPTTGAAADGTGASDEAVVAAAGDENGVGAAECAAVDDFPTTAVADYVLGCMAANGNSYEALQQCSCSIDFIKARMDYTSYEQAGTVLQVQRDIGQRGIFYRDSNWAKSRVERLEALQAESTLRCF